MILFIRRRGRRDATPPTLDTTHISVYVPPAIDAEATYGVDVSGYWASDDSGYVKIFAWTSTDPAYALDESVTYHSHAIFDTIEAGNVTELHFEEVLSAATDPITATVEGVAMNGINGPYYAYVIAVDRAGNRSEQWRSAAFLAPAAFTAADLQNARAVYGLRRCVPGYTGAMLTVRRSSDDRTADVYLGPARELLYFASNGRTEYGQAAWDDWAYQSTLYVETWYDQSGNGRHVYPVANPPTTDLALTSLVFQGSQNLRAFPGSLQGGDSTYTYAVAHKYSNVNGIQVVLEHNTLRGANGRRSCLIMIGGGVGFNGENNDAHGMHSVRAGVAYRSLLKNDNGTIRYRLNGTQQTRSLSGLNMGTDAFAFGYKISANSEYLHGEVHEALVFDAVTSAAQDDAIHASWTSAFP